MTKRKHQWDSSPRICFVCGAPKQTTCGLGDRRHRNELRLRQRRAQDPEKIRKRRRAERQRNADAWYLLKHINPETAEKLDRLCKASSASIKQKDKHNELSI